MSLQFPNADDEEPTEYGLVHSFMNQSEDFVLGWEVGMFWVVAAEQPATLYMTFHERNKGEVLRIAAHYGRKILRWEPCSEGFAFCDVGPRSIEPAP